MPELPEVETIARGLCRGADDAPPLPGRVIRRAIVRWPGHVAEPSVGAFRSRIAGRTILDVQRRGKYLVFPLDSGTLLIHLKMTGDLVLRPARSARDPFERTVFVLEGGVELRFNDARKFGRVYLVDDPSEILGALGPEPLSRSFTAGCLAERLAGRRRSLKPLLLDQGFLAGMGNIYTDEALHRARLHPLRRSGALTEEETYRLWKGIRGALRQGLRHNGASLDWVYRGGGFQHHFRVYQRAGKPCPACGTLIIRSVIGHRAAHYCPSCQQEELACQPR